MNVVGVWKYSYWILFSSVPWLVRVTVRLHVTLIHYGFRLYYFKIYWSENSKYKKLQTKKSLSLNRSKARSFDLYWHTCTIPQLPPEMFLCGSANFLEKNPKINRPIKQNNTWPKLSDCCTSLGNTDLERNCSSARHYDSLSPFQIIRGARAILYIHF